MQLRDRHKMADAKLRKLSEKLLEGNHKSMLSPIAESLGCTYQTVRNYCYGMGSDGFLKEAIIEEIKKKK